MLRWDGRLTVLNRVFDSYNIENHLNCRVLNISFKIFLFLTIILFKVQVLIAGELYDVSIDAMIDIKSAIKTAKSSNKHVFIKAGGNWCGWCKLYEKFSNSDEDIAELMKNEYVSALVNYSPENKNLEAMTFLGNPQRFGFPVFIILNGDGEVLHTQDTALLEQGKSYNKNHVLRFLKSWTYKALNP